MTKQIQSTNDQYNESAAWRSASIIGALGIRACLVIGAWSLVLSVRSIGREL
jgi:hypothetical protein